LALSLGVPYRILTYNLYIRPEDSRYREFEIRKRNGSSRKITAPDSGIKLIQRQLSQILLGIYPAKACVHGFVSKKSILSNARVHSRSRFVISIDLEGFFPSINFGRVQGIFKSHPFSFNDIISTTLAQICCHKGLLPQGAPTSPIISNYVCRRMDNLLMRLATSNKCRYSRYADDITISTNLRAIPEAIGVLENGKFVLGNEIRTIITSNNFTINEKKIRFAAINNRQHVTGLVVNQFPNIARKYIRHLRAMIHAWERFGREAAARVHYSSSNAIESYPRNQGEAFEKKVIGRVGFVGFVRDKDAELYHKLRLRVKRLSPDSKLPFQHPKDGGTPLVKVFSEGKTDPKHLSAAIRHLKSAGHFENLSLDFPSPPSMNNDKLLRMCESYSSTRFARVFIAIFDRDDKAILKKIESTDRGFRDWGNNVYSFAIQKPPHRAFDGVCLEHYYSDDELKTTDRNGFRVFLSDEFDKETGRHYSEPLRYLKKEKLNRQYPFIIDTGVVDDKGTNRALSKDMFASYVLDQEPGFDNFSFENFRLIFELIERIIDGSAK